jgi:CRP-like cAMP-binding protein
MPNKTKLHKNLFIVIYLNEIVPLSAGLKAFLVANIKSTVFEKGEIICKQGEVCTSLFVIKKGMVRGFFHEGDAEVTTWISYDNEIFTSITGYFRNQAAMENIQALEETHCVYLKYEDMIYCFKNFPEMKDLNRILMEEYYFHAENRAYMARIPNAVNRWNHFLSRTPSQIVHRIPKKYLASFLAMRPETLSRILKTNQSSKKEIPTKEIPTEHLL